jgi:hypothetical protein
MTRGLAGGVVQMVESLSSKHEALSSNPSTIETNKQKTNIIVKIICTKRQDPLM